MSSPGGTTTTNEQAKGKAQQGAQQAKRTVSNQVDQRWTQAGERAGATADDIRSVSDELRKQGKEQPAKPAEQAAQHAKSLGTKRAVQSRLRMGTRVRTGVRDVLVFAGSVAVLFFLAAYAVADPGLKIAAVAGHVREHAGREIVVDGRVLASNGDALTNAVIEVRGPDRSRLARAGAQGYFRVNLLGSCAIYRIVLRGRSHGRHLVTRIQHRLCPGDELEVEGHVVSDGQFIWMPTR